MTGSPDWNDLLHRVGLRAEEAVDRLRFALKQRVGWHEPVTVQAYRGYGTTREVFLFGRVLEDEGLRAPTPHDTPWENLLRMYKMLETDEVPCARVRVDLAGQQKTVEADEEGYVDCRLDAADSPGGHFAPGRMEATYTLLLPRATDTEHVVSRGEVFIPRPDARWIVISDVDDTVMNTHATSLLKMAVNTLLHNAYGRVAFPGVAAFYQALHHSGARSREGLNPFFYLTSSMWSLYDLMKVFFEVNNVPAGPILMRDLGVDRDKFIKTTHEAHKLGRVRQLIDLYPNQKFILIGDTGQHDAEIYREVCRQAADHVLAVYLRDVSTGGRDRRVQEIVDEIRGLGVECVSAEDSQVHAEHATEMGWITPQDLEAVREGSARDRAEDGQ